MAAGRNPRRQRTGVHSPVRPGRHESGNDALKAPETNPYEPAYMRIVRTVSDRIARGIYRPEEQLPSESRFCTEFDVSPMTLRRAINMLVDRGLVVTAQGKGTFVRPLDLGEAEFKLQDITRRWQDAGSNVRLLEATVTTAGDKAAETLQIDPGDQTVFLRRLFLADSHPFMYHTGHVIYDPHRPLVESQLQITSLEGVLQAVGGQEFAGAELSVDAVNMGEEAGRLLELPRGTAAFSLQHVFRDFEGVPVSWGTFLFRSDEFRLVTYLGAGT